MKLKQLTIEEIRNNPQRDYNGRIWDQKIDSLMKYKDLEFYVAEKQVGYDYDLFFSVYTLPDGFIVLNNFDYSSSLTSTGFVMVMIKKDGKVVTFPFLIDGEETIAAKTDHNRKQLAKMSKAMGTIYTDVL
jgi:hypothetical protein